MRHRIGGLENVYMGLGADNISSELDNKWSENEKFNTVVREMFDDALETICKKENIHGFDFNINISDDSFTIMFGIEPAYKYDPYFMICIDSDYIKSYIEKGIARGYYGRDIEITYKKSFVIVQLSDKYYMDYKDFVDKWYPKLLESLIGRKVVLEETYNDSI